MRDYMPGMDGRDVLEQLKSDSDHHASRYIAKPSDYFGFIRAVRSIEAYCPAPWIG
ncbi:MAG: hypothetical protein O7C01_04975 [Actinobacteria bacterium]|nr:hypothetical protein [Actinomycetota bacterium]